MNQPKTIRYCQKECNLKEYQSIITLVDTKLIPCYNKSIIKQQFMLFYLPKKILLALIKFYQKTLSLDHGPLKFLRPHGQCKFYPTCSEYSYSAIYKFGALKGIFLSIKRLFRCHPWSTGGYDPIK